MQRLEIEDQIQFADILKQPVQGFDKDLYQIEQSEGRFGRGGDDDEVECRIVTVGDERGGVVVLLAGSGMVAGGWREERRERQKVAGARRSGGDEGEDFRE